jgi:chromatin remodeling complex protein RSC6
MKGLFKTDRLHMFTMNKLLGDHLYNPDDVAGKVEKVEA